MNDENEFVLGILSDESVMNQRANIASIELSNARFYAKHRWKLFRLRSADCFESFDSQLQTVLRMLSSPDFSDEI